MQNCKKIRKSLSMSEMSTKTIQTLVPVNANKSESSSSASASDSGTNDRLAAFSAEFERQLELDCEKASAKYI